MAAFSVVFPQIYNTTDAVRHLATQLILVSAVMMPFNSYTNATYFTLRSGGQTMVTFIFDSCFVWLFCVPLAFGLSRLTAITIVPLYFICQATDFIKCFLGAVMLKQGKWIQNLTV
jgi:Na+-driven multidrug efflux pump